MKFTFEHKTNNTAYLLIDKLFWGEGMNHCFAMGPGIKVRGEGRMQVIPDMATITIGMLSEHPNLQTAQTENRKVSERVVQALLELGIERGNIQTEEYTIQNVYDFVDGKQVLRGYEVLHLITVKVKDIEKIGLLVDTAIQSGANQIFNIRFETEERKRYYRQALQKAVEDSREKALVLAKGAGMPIYPIPVRVVEITLDQTPIPYGGKMYQVTEATSFEPGTLVVIAVVEAVFCYRFH